MNDDLVLLHELEGLFRELIPTISQASLKSKILSVVSKLEHGEGIGKLRTYHALVGYMMKRGADAHGYVPQSDLIQEARKLGVPLSLRGTSLSPDLLGVVAYNRPMHGYFVDPEKAHVYHDTIGKIIRCLPSQRGD
ncbi:MAG: hypothetical protein HYW23_01530 [Candidatus Aenigmarchaeota archaeon]|nr:hypothetical protein [Candidatus Aenigmarchaeota archaeon]